MVLSNRILCLLRLRIVSIISALNHMLIEAHAMKCRNIRSIGDIVILLTCYGNIIMKCLSLIFVRSHVSCRH